MDHPQRGSGPGDAWECHWAQRIQTVFYNGSAKAITDGLTQLLAENNTVEQVWDEDIIMENPSAAVEPIPPHLHAGIRGARIRHTDKQAFASVYNNGQLNLGPKVIFRDLIPTSDSPSPTGQEILPAQNSSTHRNPFDELFESILAQTEDPVEAARPNQGERHSSQITNLNLNPHTISIRDEASQHSMVPTPGCSQSSLGILMTHHPTGNMMPCDDDRLFEFLSPGAELDRDVIRRESDRIDSPRHLPPSTENQMKTPVIKSKKVSQGTIGRRTHRRHLFSPQCSSGNSIPLQPGSKILDNTISDTRMQKEYPIMLQTGYYRLLSMAQALNIEDSCHQYTYGGRPLKEVLDSKGHERGQALEAFLIVNGITDEDVLRAKRHSSWSQKPLPLYGTSQETEQNDSLEY